MANGGEIAVEIVARLEKLEAGLKDAVSSVKSAGSGMAEGFKTAESAGGQLETFLTGLAGGVIGGLLVGAVEKAGEALRWLGEEFGKCVTSAKNFGIENGKLAAIMGTTVREAAALNQSLSVLGLSAQDYGNTLMKMETRLKTQEAAWNKYGVATRDANGALLQGRQLMENAINTMTQYKTGTDQNAFALEVFGRSASQVYDLMKVTDASLAEAAQDMADFGIETEKAGTMSQQFAESQDHLSNIVEDFETMVGQRLLPMLTSWSEAMAGPLKEALIGIGNAMLALIAVIEALAGAFYQLGVLAIGVAQQVLNAFNAIGSVGTAAAQAITGDFGAAGDTLSNSFSKFGTDAMDTFHTMANGAKETQANLKALMGDFSDVKAKPGERLPGQGGNKGFEKADPEGDAKAEASAKKTADQLAKIALDGEERVAEGKLRIEQQTLQHQLAMKQITQQQFVQQATQLANREYEIKRDGLQKQLELEKGDAVGTARVKSQLEQLEVEHQQKLLEITQRGDEKIKAEEDKTQKAIGKTHTDALKSKVAAHEAADKQIAASAKKTAQEEESEWTKMAKGMYSSFTGALKGMLMGTTSWKEALGQIIDGIASNFLDMVFQMLENWIFGETTKAAVSQATGTASAVSQVTSAAGVAGANTFASTAAIPITGPALAPAAAAASVAQVMGFSSLAFAEQGMELDRDRLVFAHKDEQILPANIAGGMKQIINNGGTNSKKSDTKLTYAPTINAPQHKSLGSMLQEEASTMRSWLKAQQRDGWMNPA